MKIIVTHESPDMDAITSVWLIKKYLPGWAEAKVEFVPAGERRGKGKAPTKEIEKTGEDEVIHVDTGMGPLDHHQTGDRNVCAASLTWDYVKSEFEKTNVGEGEKWDDKKKAIDRIVRVVVDIDHFREVFWENPTADHYEFNLVNLLEGLKIMRPNDNDYYVEYVMESLDILLHEFGNKIWAEGQIKKGIEFETKFGKAIGFETINDSVLKLAQKMGYEVAIRKDPRKGYVRIKARPDGESNSKSLDLTPVYEQLKKMDPEATWFLHASKKMLLNGSAKNPKMRSSKLSLNDIIGVLKGL